MQYRFSIEFAYTGISEDTTEPRYQAMITTLSKSLNLFKVSRIRKIVGEDMIELNGCYHVTSHPITELKDDNWKDAVTCSTSGFVQAIGRAIEKHLYTVEEVAPYLN